MRILVAHAFYRIPGGEDRYVEQQVELLRERHQVELFSARNEELKGSSEAALRMLAPGGVRKRLEAVARGLAPDVIHVHNIYPALGAAVHTLARKLDVPLVMTVHNHRLRCPNGYRFTEGQVCDRCVGGNHLHALMHECFPSKGQAAGYATALWIDRFARRVDTHVDLFIAPSRYMADRLGMWGISPDRVRMVRNFTDTSARPATPAEHGVYAGRLSSEKGLDVLLEALKRCGDPPFELLGDGPLSAPLEKMASDLGLHNLKFRGRVDRVELDRLLATARYFVMPSLSDENAPLAVFEAMARGVPPVVSNRGGLPELVQDSALVTIPGDPEDLARAIEALRRDDELRSRASRAARDFAVSELGPDRHRDQLEAVYEAAVAMRVPTP
ncbi:MAG TPA: glycosyltransferase family 4 protein [Actinomycetota bacterium]|nr:glycosyltransferase family 4 protein [Actinomycetota bacterium]